MEDPAATYTYPGPTNGHSTRPGMRIDRYERTARVVVGGALMIFGMTRRSRLGWLVTASGAVVAYRGLTGRRAVGRRVAIPRAIDVRHSIDIASPPGEVYRFWRDLTNMPRFMAQVSSVEVVSARDRIYRWTSRMGPLRFEYDAEITHDLPGRRLEWRSLPDAELPSRGEVALHAGPDGLGTALEVRLEVLPPGGAAMLPFRSLLHRMAEQQLTRDLARLKQILETRP